MAEFSNFNHALISIRKRAEKNEAENLQRTFADVGVMPRLAVADNQVVYGRRGTGKTHALRKLQAEVTSRGDVALFLSLDTLGTTKDFTERRGAINNQVAANLLADFLEGITEELRDAIAERPELESPQVVDGIEALEEHFGSLRSGTRVTRKTEDASSISSRHGAELGGDALNLRGNLIASEDAEDSTRHEEMIEDPVLDFADLKFSTIARQMNRISRGLRVKRLWLLIDEWSKVPLSLQPYLAQYISQSLFSIQRITVKIAAIEQRTNFRTVLAGEDLGIELGADMVANLNLDHELAYERNPEKSVSFFRSLFYKHLASAEALPSGEALNLKSPDDLVREGFKDKRAFEELVRASEGIPRDAISIGDLAAGRAEDRRISVSDVREAAREWYLQDKSQTVVGTESGALLLWIIDEIIKGKKSRGFLVEEHDSSDARLLYLFDRRVLHIVKKGYSAQDRRGERFDIWIIDYGAYVDLLNTSNEPRQLLPGDAPGMDTDVEVPNLDGRSMRRSILNLEKFDSSSSKRSKLKQFRS